MFSSHTLQIHCLYVSKKKEKTINKNLNKKKKKKGNGFIF